MKLNGVDLDAVTDIFIDCICSENPTAEPFIEYARTLHLNQGPSLIDLLLDLELCYLDIEEYVSASFETLRVLKKKTSESRSGASGYRLWSEEYEDSELAFSIYSGIGRYHLYRDYLLYTRNIVAEMLYSIVANYYSSQGIRNHKHTSFWSKEVNEGIEMLIESGCIERRAP